jgi:aspartate aminotransferase
VLLTAASKRTKRSATLAMNERVRQLRKSGKDIFHMGFGEAPFPIHPIIQKALCDNAHQRSYLPTQGILPLREQICAFYENMFGLQVLPEQIIVGPGSKVLLYNAMMALEGPIFVPTPSWVSYDDQARLLGKEVYYIRTNIETSYLMTAEAFEKALQNNSSQRNDQKILVLNYPNNPTGQNYTKAQLKEIADVARENNVIILSDEIYALLTYQDFEHHSVAEYYPEGTLVTGGLSKDRSAGGFRVGVILLPKGESELLESMLTVASNTWSCLAAPIQYAAIEAYRPNPDISNYIKDCTAICELVTKHLHQKLRDSGIRCLAPMGAFYLFPDWESDQKILASKGIKTSIDISEVLLRDWNVATLPGSDFGMIPKNLCIRLATVDFDGKAALERYRENPHKARNDPDSFTNRIAPRLITAIETLERFTESYQ